MTSIRLRLLLSLLAMLALAALAIGALTYRSVLAETEALFDYQLRQMALSLRDQGEIAPDQAGALADEQLDFVVQIWSADGRSIYATRLHSERPFCESWSPPPQVKTAWTTSRQSCLPV